MVRASGKEAGYLAVEGGDQMMETLPKFKASGD